MFSFKLMSAKIPYLNRGEEYTSLQNGTSSPGDECEVEDKIPLYLRTTPHNANSGRFWRFSVILLLLITNLTTFAALFSTRHLTSRIEAADPIHTPNSWGMRSDMPENLTRLICSLFKANLSAKHVSTLYHPNSPASTGGQSTVIRISQKPMLLGTQ